MLHLQHYNWPGTIFKYQHRYEPVCVCVRRGIEYIVYIYVFSCHSKLNGTLHLWTYNTYVEELKETHLPFLTYMHTLTHKYSPTHTEHIDYL